MHLVFFLAIGGEVFLVFLLVFSVVFSVFLWVSSGLVIF